MTEDVMGLRGPVILVSLVDREVCPYETAEQAVRDIEGYELVAERQLIADAHGTVVAVDAAAGYENEWQARPQLSRARPEELRVGREVLASRRDPSYSGHAIIDLKQVLTHWPSSDH